MIIVRSLTRMRAIGEGMAELAETVSEPEPYWCSACCTVHENDHSDPFWKFAAEIEVWSWNSSVIDGAG